MTTAALATLIVPLVANCGSDEDEKTGECSIGNNSECETGQECQVVTGGEPACFCSLSAQTGCGEDLACEQIQGANTDCFAPISIQGQVIDLATGMAIEGARVVARDGNNAAVSGVVVTDAMGNYTLPVPTPRNADGTAAGQNEVTLRADAAGYQTFPLPPRQAIPIIINSADLVSVDGGSAIQSEATTIGLLALENATGLGTISGRVIEDSETLSPWGTLIVAGGAVMGGGAATGVADRDGSFTVFNVLSGMVSVDGYKQGLQIDAVTVDVPADGRREDVELHVGGEATTVVSGNIQIVNAPGGATTSVILVVAETFLPLVARGEAPPGLRVGPPTSPVSGDWQIPGVPDGNYVVLAAFENDIPAPLVRDPDTSIGGTEIGRITVPGAVAPSFKVTEALPVVSPDNEAIVTGTPSFVWEDDSSEDHYEVRVYDSFGNLVWEDLAVDGVSGGATVTVAYGGPALEPGMVYQFRATSIGNDGVTPISQTEDLRGVFQYQ